MVSRMKRTAGSVIVSHCVTDPQNHWRPIFALGILVAIMTGRISGDTQRSQFDAHLITPVPEQGSMIVASPYSLTHSRTRCTADVSKIQQRAHISLDQTSGSMTVARHPMKARYRCDRLIEVEIKMGQIFGPNESPRSEVCCVTCPTCKTDVEVDRPSWPILPAAGP